MRQQQECFPEPRYPILAKIDPNELTDRIRRFVSPSASELKYRSDGTRSQSFPNYDMGRGDHVLVVGSTDYDSEVINAYANALREKGAAVDVLFFESGPLGSAEEAAAYEAMTLVVGADNQAYTRFCDVIMSETAKRLVASEKYSAIVAGTAGPRPSDVPTKWKRTPYISVEEVASGQLDFPLELQYTIDRVLYDQIKSLEKARLTDPEGTDISWTNYDDKRTMSLSHEWGKPCNIGFGGEPDCSGVVAGTLNHMGAFPHLKAYLKDDLVVRVEGGGRFGDVWREKIEELNKIDTPPIPIHGSGQSTELYKLPGPGFFWYWELAIGTVPGIFRLPRESRFECFANFLHERRRAGYVHSGFGAPGSAKLSFTKAGIPWTHVHVHSVFGTLEGVTKDGTVVRLIDKGHLTALDDSGVKQVASSYGKPEELLKESWIPAIPGINSEGSYSKDYASDPASWITQEAERYGKASFEKLIPDN